MRLYENAARGVEILHEAEQALASDQARLKGRLRLSLPPGFEPWWELLGVFQRRYPDIRVQVFTSERRIDLVEDGVDVALRVGAVAHEAMVARRLFAYRHVLVGSPRLLEREGGMETLDDLRRFPAGMWYPGGSGEGAWLLGGQAVKPRIVLATNDYAHLRARALDAELVTELPPFMAAAAVRAGQLIELLPEHPCRSRRSTCSIRRTGIRRRSSGATWISASSTWTCCTTPVGWTALRLARGRTLASASSRQARDDGEQRQTEYGEGRCDEADSFQAESRDGLSAK